MILESILWLMVSSYTVFTLLLYFLWNRLDKPSGAPGSDLPVDQPAISVIIPVRNEADHLLNLLEDFEKQTLEPSFFEILVVNDASTDQTAEIVEEFRARTTLSVQLISLDETTDRAPKKTAITRAIALSRGHIVVTTDGDCRIAPQWLESHWHAFVSGEVQMVSGPVTFTKETHFSDYLQTVEFSSLIGSGACSIAVGKPTMCNGANLAYRKSAFQEVGGFEGVNQIASGDDEFLMHKIAKTFPGSIRFLKTSGAIVRTIPHRNWSDFYQQRKRWAGKWNYYQTRAPKILAAYIFAINFSLLLCLLLTLAGQISGYTLLALGLLKILPEWLFISTVLRFLEKSHCIPAIPVVQLLYPLYVTVFGLSARTPTYAWKGRKLE